MQDGVGFGIEVGAGRETEFLLKLRTLLNAGVVVSMGLVFGCFCFHLLDASVGCGDLLDGIEKLAGDARIELSGGEGLSDVGEGGADGVGVVEGWDLEAIGLVIAQGAGATQTAGALQEVVVAIFALAESRGAAVGSVGVEVTTGFVLHKARFLSIR